MNMEFGMQTEPINYVRDTIIVVSQELQNILLGWNFEIFMTDKFNKIRSM
jgi:hypothetical protein